MITDVAMPGMNGVELARRVRTISRDLPILFSSGYADIQTFGEELSEGTVLKKPFRMAEVASRIESALQGSATADEEASKVSTGAAAEPRTD
jgi:FixJ family two-component response regulator